MQCLVMQRLCILHGILAILNVHVSGFPLPGYVGIGSQLHEPSACSAKYIVAT